MRRPSASERPRFASAVRLPIGSENVTPTRVVGKFNAKRFDNDCPAPPTKKPGSVPTGVVTGGRGGKPDSVDNSFKRARIAALPAVNGLNPLTTGVPARTTE